MYPKSKSEIKLGLSRCVGAVSDWVVRRMPIELGIMPKNYAGIMPRNVLGIMPNYAQNATLFRHYAENF